MRARAKTRRMALTEGTIAGILFGSAALMIRALQGIGALSIAFWRLAIASLALAVVLLLLRKPLATALLRKNLKKILFLSVFLGLHFIFFALAVADTTILNATVLVNTAPVFSMLVSGLVFKLRPSSIAVLGLAISLVGVCFIAYAETNVASISPHQANHGPTMKGDLEALFAAAVEAVYLNYGRELRSQMNLFSIMLPVYLFASIFVGVLSIPVGGMVLALPARVDEVLVLVGLGILPTAVAHTLYFSSLSNLKSFETATMAFLEPVGATILGIGLLQEVPGSLFILGAALALIGMFFVVRNKG